MTNVLICAGDRLAAILKESPVWRRGVERATAGTSSAALAALARTKFSLVLIDRDLGQAESLTRQIRGSYPCSIAIVASGDAEGSEIGLLEAGANAVLRLPPGPEWEERLARLLAIPARKQLRIHVDLEIEGLFESQVVSGRALNLSRNGMLVACAGNLAVGEPLRFALHLNSSTVLEGVARIVRLAAPGQYGCAFIDIKEYDQRRLDYFLQSA